VKKEIKKKSCLVTDHITKNTLHLYKKKQPDMSIQKHHIQH